MSRRIQTAIDGAALSRRHFLSATSALALSAVSAGAQPLSGSPIGPLGPRARAARALAVRKQAAQMARDRPVHEQLANGDDLRHPRKFGSFTKGLPHDAFGEVDREAYSALVLALEMGEPALFEAIPLGGTRRLVNPQAALAFDLEGADSHSLTMAPAPALASAEAGGELVENYWLAEARDVSFTDFPSSPVIAAATADLTRLQGFSGPRDRAGVTAATVFRGSTPGDRVGPWLSQFLWLDIPMGAVNVRQTMQTVLPGIDYLTTYDEWLRIQNGGAAGSVVFDNTPRYIRNLRDLAQWVHVDALYQAYHQACLILLGMGAPLDRGNPYSESRCQEGFGTFGGPHILSLVTEVATRALKAVWYQKWAVHRRLRPEAMAGLVHHTRLGTRRYPLHRDLLQAAILDRLQARTGTCLLSSAFPEGSPMHPSYGAGHATVAGACVTMLKAWFDESFVLPSPVEADRDGLALVPYTGAALTVGGELNKLAANVAIGRNAAGVHYRSDYWQSLQLGEGVALTILEEQKATYNEAFSLSFRRFDGTRVVV